MKRGQDPNWRKMFAIRNQYFYFLTDDEFREWCSMLLRHDITSRKDLTPEEVILVNAGMEGFLFMSHQIRQVRGTREMVEPDSPDSQESQGAQHEQHPVSSPDPRR